MKRSILAWGLCALLTVAPSSLLAQVEQLTEWQRQSFISRLPEVTASAKGAALRTHLQGHAKPATPAARLAAVNAARVALDVTNVTVQAPFIHYAVPPMSEYQRLPDLYPVDGEAGAPVRIVAAQISSRLLPVDDLGKVAFSPPSACWGKVFPAAQRP